MSMQNVDPELLRRAAAANAEVRRRQENQMIFWLVVIMVMMAVGGGLGYLLGESFAIQKQALDVEAQAQQNLHDLHYTYPY